MNKTSLNEQEKWHMTTAVDPFSLQRMFIAPSNYPQQPTLAQNWVGGVMTQWDAISYRNTVRVGPVTYQNLPVVSPNGLTRGTVLLARGPAGYIVMGMLGTAAGATLIDPIRYRRLDADLSVPNTTLADAGVLNFQLASDTEYALDGALFYSSTTSSDMQFAWAGPPNMAVKWGMYGVNNATTYSVNQEIVSAYGDANPQTIQGVGIPMQCKPSGWFATTDTPGILQLRVALASGSTAGTLQKGSWLRISELGSASGSTVHVKTYACTGSRSYDDSGNPIGGTDQDDNIYQGIFPDRSFGSEKSMLIFPGSTMRSDLSGASLLSGRLWLYCHKAEDSTGSLEIKSEPNTSVPATYSPGVGNEGTLSFAWDVNSWNSIEVLYDGGSDGSILNRILAGANAVGLPPTILGARATGFRGYGFSVNYRPYFEVTYVT